MKKIFFIISLVIANLSYAQNTKQEKVEVKKSKDGSNVYNLNFYNKKSNKKEKQKEDDIKDKDLVVYKKRNEIKNGNGLEVGIFTMSHPSDLGEVADLNLGLGLRVGFMMKSEDSGIYFTPGIFIINTGANFNGLGDNFMARKYDGSAFGGYFKIGKLIDRGYQFLIDAGIKGSYMSGDMETDNIFGNGSYKFNSANFSAYSGPVFKVDNFLISGLLNLGVSRVSANESVTSSSFSPKTSSYSNEKMVPFYGLSVNATFVF